MKFTKTLLALSGVLTLTACQGPVFESKGAKELRLQHEEQAKAFDKNMQEQVKSFSDDWDKATGNKRDAKQDIGDARTEAARALAEQKALERLKSGN